MPLYDIIQLLILAATLIPAAISQLRRNSVANHNDYLGRIIGYLGRSAAEIHEQLLKLPPGADAMAVRRALIAAAVKQTLQEFDTSAAATKATPEKLAGILDRQVSDRLTGGKGIGPVVGQVTGTLDDDLAAGAMVPALAPQAR